MNKLDLFLKFGLTFGFGIMLLLLSFVGILLLWTAYETFWELLK